MEKKARKDSDRPGSEAEEPQGAADESPAGEPVEAAGGDIEALARERDEYFDRYMRARAELANFRKRVERERAEIRDRVTVELVREILPALDDFQRALDHGRETSDFEGLASGVELVERKLLKTLEGFGVSPIEAVGRPFDPAVHEAMTVLAVPGAEPGTVVEELRKGYVLGDRVVRPSQVVVSESSGPQRPCGGTEEALEDEREQP